MADETSDRDRIARAFLEGGGEMHERTRGFDWSTTPVGALATWPQSLRTLVRTMLDSRYAMWLGWGPDFTFFYNDAYARMTLGAKHPHALGRPAREVWSEIWPDVGPRAESVIRTGQATWDEGLLLFLERQGFPEETYHTFSYSPVPDDAGGVGGLLCVVTEDSERTIGERRLRTLRELAARTNDEAKSIEGACQTAARTLVGNPHDLPFVVLYVLSEDGQRARRLGQSGLPDDSPACPLDVDLDHSPWPFRQVAESGRAHVVDDLTDRFGPLLGGAWPEPTARAMVLPLARLGQTRPTGFVVAGISPRLVFNDAYRGFLDLLAGHVANAIANARAYEEERQRAEQLAELDRAKTAFFSNVSHEFRTPLTLILGPVEDTLASSDELLPPSQRERLEVAHRNGLRLQRLVNSLLDFSRIEAGRVRATYEPTDLASFTIDLASNFRSACEQAGLKLQVDCPPLSEPVFVDRSMWEKIVLNLLSNAFKFTFEGQITVALRQAEGAVELRVQDTGTGIPAAEMPRLFERFHRAENVRGRTHEGSGIGLALVQELVKLHGGVIAAESEVDRGTVFNITIPLGNSHLPHDQVRSDRSATPPTTEAGPFVEEALRWLPDGEQREDPGSTSSADPGDLGSPLPSRARPGAAQPRVLVADDNADMRRYIERLLDGQYQVQVVSDGEAALAAARRKLPDLILSDVMMPRLDGFGLLRELRADPQTAGVPLILLSARAGEESRVEGMQAGADDYLVKPFSAKELLVRIAALLQINRLRRESERAVRQSEERFRFLFETMTEGFAIDEIIYDEAGRVCDLRCLEVNPALERHTGLNRADLIGRTTREVFPDAESDWFERFTEVANTGRPAHFQAKFGPLDRWFEISSYRARPGQLATVFFDITEQKRSEERERQLLVEAALANARFRAFFEQGALFAGIMQTDGTLIEANRLSLDACGYTRADVIGRPFCECPWWNRSPELMHRIDRATAQAAAGEAFRAELPYFLADGTERTVDFILLPIKDETGRVMFLAPTGTDITERKRAEHALHQSEIRERLRAEELEAVMSAVPAVVWIAHDASCRRITGNRASYELLRLPHGANQSVTADVPDSQPAHFRVMKDGVEIPPDQLPVQRAASGIEVRDFEEEIVFADGTRTHLFGHAMPLRDEAGHVRGSVAAFVDITDRKRAEAAVRESEALFRSMADNAPAMLWVTDPTGYCTYLSAMWYQFTARTPGTDVGYGWLDAIHPDDLDRSRSIFLQASRDQLPFSIDYRLRRRDGEYRWSVDTGLPRFDGAEFQGFVGCVFDVHERKTAEDANQRLVADLRHADQRKDEFLATLAHELRNPLAPIRNGLQILRMAHGDSVATEQARSMMERQLAQMVHLVDDLLDLSRISRGKIELRQERIELAKAIQHAVETSRPAIEQAGHELQIEVPSRPIYVDADVTRLAQVFSNLLNNAAKYTERGGRIRLAVQHLGTEAVVSVKDTGIGIPAHMLPHVFDMFTQVDRNLERSQGGLGIGLSIVKRLVQMHGGSVEVQSAGHGMGSEFIVRLPVVLSVLYTGRGDDVEIVQPSDRRRVLVVDDNRDAAVSLAMLVKLMGNETRTAHDGLEALEVAAAYRPDVILLDIGMPRMNGYDTAREIRNQPWGQGVLLVALTGWGQEEDRRKSEQAGFNMHLVKPIEPAALEKLLASLKADTG